MAPRKLMLYYYYYISFFGIYLNDLNLYRLGKQTHNLNVSIFQIS